MTISRRFLGLSTLALLGACLDRESVTGMQSDPAVFEGVVSDPVRLGPGSLAPRNTIEARDSVVYVSLAPGTIARGADATIRNRTTGYRRTDPIVEGGLDPVPVPALAGDTLEITLRDSAGTLRESESVVPIRVPPIVVRTEPPHKKTDVPLNTAIAIVFSEPVDPKTVGPQSVRLLRAGQLVGGGVSVSAEGLRITFVPDAPLAPETDYMLEVTEVADLSGDRLEPVEVDFTTGSQVIPVASVTVTPQSTSIENGMSVQLTATTRSASGVVLAGRAVVWSSSNPAVLRTDAAGKVLGASTGTADVIATVEGQRGTAVITVNPLVFVSVSAGGNHTCGLTSLGSVLCWGGNDAGQLGSGDFAAFLTPHRVAGGLTFLTVDAGSGHTCGVAKNGSGYCWGTARNRGNVNPKTFPERVPGLLTFTSLDAGELHTCGLSPSGTVYCWGQYNVAGSYVTTWLSDDIRDPSPMSDSFPTLAVVTTGAQHGCGVAVNGRAYCWGTDNQFGVLGNGSTQPSITYVVRDSLDFKAVPVAGGLRFVSLSAGRYHTCGIATGGAAYCWGATRLDDLFGSISPNLLTPALVAGGFTFTSISAGDYHTCGITTAGLTTCWGENASGQLGDGSTSGSRVPVMVSTNLRFTSVTAGGGHTCGVATDGAVYCWGDNRFGQLGDGTHFNSLVPVLVAGQR